MSSQFEYWGKDPVQVHLLLVCSRWLQNPWTTSVEQCCLRDDLGTLRRKWVVLFWISDWRKIWNSVWTLIQQFLYLRTYPNRLLSTVTMTKGMEEPVRKNSFAFSFEALNQPGSAKKNCWPSSPLSSSLINSLCCFVSSHTSRTMWESWKEVRFITLAQRAQPWCTVSGFSCSAWTFPPGLPLGIFGL